MNPVWLTVFGFLVFVSGVALRVTHLISEWTFVIIAFLGGVAISHESVTGLFEKVLGKKPPADGGS